MNNPNFIDISAYKTYVTLQKSTSLSGNTHYNISTDIIKAGLKSHNFISGLI